ncbi:MAG TPA: pyruvate dehydrogenase (acetyl-transferring), homodimeric type [Acidobacteriota bacterium]|nr:pyruvate dehydrogenase (acetyl-transferring), homodimeric type [Acidobacteriota bacterium]
MPTRPKPLFEVDSRETREWIESLEAVLHHDGSERAGFLLARLADRARLDGIEVSTLPSRYTNTIGIDRQPPYPGNLELEERISACVRWNAMAMVVRANRTAAELGGHLSTYASAEALYDVGFNHFFRAHTEEQAGDLVYFQGHSSPGIYARAFLEGRLTEEDLDGFRREAAGGGLPSYPHPWLMRDFWQFATVSMGLGPIMAIYQARFLRYLENRGLAPRSDRKIWAFLGDGEMDEPESLGAITVAAREGLGNLVFVVNCNLQRLDGPVRGNGSIVRELEAVFRGAGWNVLKVLWGTAWDEWLTGPHADLLVRRMEEAVDGDYQAYAADSSGKLLREKFFGRYPELASLVESMTDKELAAMPSRRGGHDERKVYAAYAAAAAHRGQPTIILAKTIKGYGLGTAAARNPTHQQKKLSDEGIRAYRDWLHLPIPDDEIHDLPYVQLPDDAANYLHERRASLGGAFPARRIVAEPLEVPPLDAFKAQLRPSGDREFSTTMVFVRMLSALLRNEAIGSRVVPIVPDEARTFGMEGLFRQVGIYAPYGQLYTPTDRDQLAYYREDQAGQILQEGITEAGAFSSWIAAATAYVNHGLFMLPFYIYYSMFGLQRIGDLAWAAADMQARGFLLGATSGRTTLAGEGLQHTDGHSHVLASAIPTCRAYDPTYAHEVAVIIQHGMEAMYAKNESAFYYLTLMNENYPHPGMPEDAAEGIVRGMYLLRAAEAVSQVQLMGSGAILREVEAAAEMLAIDFDISADVWSVTSFTELGRDGMAAARWNRLHPEAPARRCFVQQQLAERPGPVVAATDYLETFPEQIRPFVERRVVALGTNGFGRSDTRSQLRSFFEVDRRHIVVAALKALADDEVCKPAMVAAAINKYDIDPDAIDPATA